MVVLLVLVVVIVALAVDPLGEPRVVSSLVPASPRSSALRDEYRVEDTDHTLSCRNIELGDRHAVDLKVNLSSSQRVECFLDGENKIVTFGGAWDSCVVEVGEFVLLFHRSDTLLMVWVSL